MLLLLYPSKEEKKKIDAREWQRTWRRTHREEHYKIQREWSKTPQGKACLSKRKRKYRDSHKEDISKKYKEWYSENREYNINRVVKYIKDRPELNRAKCNKRRQLDYNPLNKFSLGDEGHHLDKKNVIYIPEGLHHSIPHCQDNNESMKRINILAFDYMSSTCL